MPKFGKRSYKKSANKRRTRRKPKTMALYKPMHSFGPKQYAHIRETVEYQNETSNTMINWNFTLAEFERANLLSQNFKWVRPARVTYTYEPMYNTYQASSQLGSQPGIPYLYTVMNRTQDRALIGNSVPSNLLAQGAKPKKLSRVIKISYVPNWCSPGLLGAYINNNNYQNIVQIGSKVEYGWVPCPNAFSRYSALQTQGIEPDINASSFTQTGSSLVGFGGVGNNWPSIASNAVTYNGHYAIVEQVNKPPSAVYKVSVTVDWVFKDPKYVNAVQTTDLYTHDASGNTIESDVNTGQV